MVHIIWPILILKLFSLDMFTGKLTEILSEMHLESSSNLILTEMNRGNLWLPRGRNMRRSRFEKNLFQKEDTELLGFASRNYMVNGALQKLNENLWYFKACVKLFITLYVDSTVMHSNFFTAANSTRVSNHDRTHPNYCSPWIYFSMR